MHALIWLGLVSLCLSLVLTPVFRDIFRHFGFLDHPDQGRKTHGSPIPRAGGIAIVVSCVSSFLIVQLATGIIGSHLVLVWKILPAAALMFVVGLIDDLWGLKPWQKLSGQIVAAAVACWSGILILDIVGVHEQAWWTIPVTILWLLACSNAFNLVDGMDGLATGVGLFATVTIFVAALLQHNIPLAMATVSLAGCLLGFLRYNFHPASVFLGDSGSLVIGFVLGCYGIIWTQKSATFLGLTAPLMALAIPLFDVSLAIARRLLRTQPIFSADRGHIHHRLLDRGMSPRRVVLLLYGVSGLVAVFSLFQSFSHSNRIASVIVLLFCVVAWAGIQYLGYIEFALAGRHLFGGDFQRSVKAQIDLQTFASELTNLGDPEKFYGLIRDTAGKFGFRVSRLQIAGENFAETAEHLKPFWTACLLLDSGDFVELARDFEDATSSAAAGLFIDALRRGLTGAGQPVLQFVPAKSRFAVSA
jgi:UDP-GlcNAc:undecaprenyl-phosphate/decaprenyl-phosphate GlcNAc-1-phosphate transferase